MSSENYLDPDMKLLALVVYLRNRATEFYNDDDYQPYSDITKRLKYRGVKSHFGPPISEWLIEKGIEECAAYKQSNSAIVLAARTASGKNAIIRLPAFGSQENHRRISHPAALQPFPGATLTDKNGNIEILPFVKVVGLWDDDGKSNPIVEQGEDYLNSVYRIAGLLTPMSIRQDLGILPDGTPVAVDPDLLIYREKLLSFEENVQRQKMIIQKYPYMAPIAWIENGKPKQDKFFGADYLTGKPAVPVSKLDGNSRGGQKPALGSPAQG